MIVAALFILVLVALMGLYVWLSWHPGRRVRADDVRDVHRDARAFGHRQGAYNDQSWTTNGRRNNTD